MIVLTILLGLVGLAFMHAGTIQVRQRAKRLKNANLVTMRKALSSDSNFLIFGLIFLDTAAIVLFVEIIMVLSENML
jgi:hypothetical protein